MKITQEEFAKRASMTLSSYKRFEQKGLISLDSLIKIAIVLGCEDEFDSLFATRKYKSIEDVMNERI
ncbi:MAG: helix-turn-helix transcriptional regulator [Eggerthellaceae bacterium]|nr:helix-turn-helix transcriptional regulator [Eggerthellaceae bacterium]